MKLRIENPLTGEIERINLPTRKGYSPYLFVGDFTGDGAKEVLVNFKIIPDQDYIYSYIYRFNKKEPQLIFDSRKFASEDQGRVKFMDEERVQVEPTTLPKLYRIDLSSKEKTYLNEIYDKDNNLKQALQGEIRGLVAANPIDYDAINRYDLATTQPITGKNIADVLALLQLILKWNNKEKMFEPIAQYVALLGKDK